MDCFYSSTECRYCDDRILCRPKLSLTKLYSTSHKFNSHARGFGGLPNKTASIRLIPNVNLLSLININRHSWPQVKTANMHGIIFIGAALGGIFGKHIANKLFWGVFFIAPKNKRTQNHPG